MKKEKREEQILNTEKSKTISSKKSSTTKEILLITYLFVFLFLGMMGYLIKFMLVDSEEVINNSFNPRQEILASRNIRGTIYSNNMEILAETLTDQAGNEYRNYPFENLFSHVVGYSSNGKMGVELLANYQLLSCDAFIGEKVQNDLSNQKNMGNSVVTTLDTKLQKVAYDSLGVYRGAIVVMEPKTGRILALVSKPDFNPNNIDSIWENLITDANSSVLLNRVTQGLYPPGSTFKIITALEFIRENPTTFQNYTYQCNSQYREGKDVINCYHGTSHGSEDLFKSFAKSCNASFANIGSQLDKNSFEKTLEDLLFHCELPLKVEYSKSSINMSDETTTSDLLQSAIGQGKTQITPMHLALITSSIANRGTLMKPYFVEKVISSNGGVVKQYGKNNKYGELMTTEEAQILTELLTEVVQTGTGTKLKSLSYQAAGKTGSAEYNNNKNDSHAWFTGFAPADDPQIVVTIIIEGAGSGGDYAVPIAKRIFEAYLGE